MRVLLVDNYDSFTWNLVHYLEIGGAEVVVMKNDKVNFMVAESCDKVVLSPGPGLPSHSGKLMKVVHYFAGLKPIFGVCLGFQALTEFYHGKLFNQGEVKHGVAEKCHVLGGQLFKGIPDEFKVGLYHSWAADPMLFPRELIVTARSESGTIMAFEHKRLPIAAVQFHPESILTEFGQTIVNNFLRNFN